MQCVINNDSWESSGPLSWGTKKGEPPADTEGARQAFFWFEDYFKRATPRLQSRADASRARAWPSRPDHNRHRAAREAVLVKEKFMMPGM